MSDNNTTLVFTNDFLLHSPQNNAVKHTFLQSLLNIPIKTATGKQLISLTEKRDGQGEIFSREQFFLLSQISLSPIDSYFFFDKKKITNESISYLKQFCNENTIIIGIELSLCLREILTSINCRYINFWFHPYHLFDDIFFGIATNNEIIFDKLHAYMIPEDYFYFYAMYWKEKINKMQNLENLFSIEENSAIFIGQTMKDQSIERDGIFLNITHFPEICRKEFPHYSKVYYIPHPYEKKIPKNIMNFLKQYPQITILQNVPVYYLLASSKIKKVFGISSSVLYEAKFFGKDVQYFYQPLFHIDTDFNLNTFISIYNDYFTPSFWGNVLETVVPCRTNIPNYNLLEKATNKLREVTASYHGYFYLDKIQIIQQKIENDKFQQKEFRRLCIFFLITLISCYPLLEISSCTVRERVFVYTINIMRFLTPLVLIFFYRQTLFSFKRKLLIFILFFIYILLITQNFL